MSRKFRTAESETPCEECEHCFSNSQTLETVCDKIDLSRDQYHKGETTKPCKDFRVRYERIKI